MAERKTDFIKNIMINLGIALILFSAITTKDAGAAFFLGLILLALQTFDLKGTERRKIVVAEIILASSLSLGVVVKLFMSKRFDTPQVFMIIMLLGAIMVTAEAIRKHADL